MFTVELACFEFDLPDHAGFDGSVSTPNPLFQNNAVTTQWLISLERFEMTVSVSAKQTLTDLSRRAFDHPIPGQSATSFNQNGIPAMRYGVYDQLRTQIDWGFYLQGLMLSFTLRPKTVARLLPTEGEQADHEAIIQSVRRSGLSRG